MSADTVAEEVEPEPRRFDPTAWLHPATWGIAARSAVVSATAVLVAVLIIGAALVFILYMSLLSSVDGAAAARVRDVVAALHFTSATELDDDLLIPDERVWAIQVLDTNGAVVRSSASAPGTPLLPPEYFRSSVRSGIPDELAPNHDMRMSGQTADTATGRYTVIVGAGSEGAQHSAVIVTASLLLAAPIIAGVAAMVTYRLVRRSLHSVEEIRTRVAEISASDLGERVPVPVQRDEISALAMTMNEMLARVESGHAAQRRFVGDASHELRSPLASIISALEVAQDYPETVDDDLRSGTLIPEAHRMQNLVEDLLLLARADERGPTTRRDEVRIDALLDAERLRLLRETDLDVRVDAETVTVTGDLDGIGRVLRNLVDNAVHHAASAVALGVRLQDDEAHITVSDDGRGIPVGDRGRVFDRFVRLDADRSRGGGGSGLGLAIVAEIVTGHGGTVGIDDRTGGGTVVTVRLPVTRTDASPASTDHRP